MAQKLVRDRRRSLLTDLSFDFFDARSEALAQRREPVSSQGGLSHQVYH
jgi:hypothetical protein